jgi:hypothetical protein
MASNEVIGLADKEFRSLRGAELIGNAAHVLAAWVEDAA